MSDIFLNNDFYKTTSEVCQNNKLYYTTSEVCLNNDLTAFIVLFVSCVCSIRRYGIGYILDVSIYHSVTEIEEMQ